MSKSNHPCPECGSLMVWQGSVEVCPYIHEEDAKRPTLEEARLRMTLADEEEVSPEERLKAAIIAADVAACAERVSQVDRAKIFEQALRERWFQARVM